MKKRRTVFGPRRPSRGYRADIGARTLIPDGRGSTGSQVELQRSWQHTVAGSEGCEGARDSTEQGVKNGQIFPNNGVHFTHR